MTPTPPAALTGTYRIDPSRTRLSFVVRQAMVAKVRGTFDRFSGLADLDFADPARSRVEVTVEVASLTTGNARRDAHLRTSFFHAAEHPRIDFRSTAVDALTDDRYLVTGELTIKGRTRPVSIEVTRTGMALDPDGTSRVEMHRPGDPRPQGLGSGLERRGRGRRCVRRQHDRGRARGGRREGRPRVRRMTGPRCHVSAGPASARRFRTCSCRRAIGQSPTARAGRYHRSFSATIFSSSRVPVPSGART